MTQYLLSVIGDEDRLAEVTEEQTQQMFAQVGAFNDELQQSGKWVFGGGLHLSSSATVVKVLDGATVTTDGPFTESKEQLGGFWIIEAADLDEALELAAKGSAACSNPVEVRPFQDV